jgi:cobyrinic acid a,c-diamide synthase
MVTRREVQVLLVAGVASGQGKTTVTAALSRALSARGKRVRVFKCGPDFIDPMLLERACGTPVLSLDLWMVGLEQSRAQIAQAAQDADVILIEGVMGLYDGTPSSADLARALGIPVLAVIDASAMAQTAGALVLGLRDYGPVELAGVVANRVASDGHVAMVKAALRDIPLIAVLPRQERALPERHLGLVPPAEVDELDTLLDGIAGSLAIDEQAWAQMRTSTVDTCAPVPGPAALLEGSHIAIARDAAFAFLYPANLATLREMGATLSFFSPLADEAVPAGASAVYIPGGYPELHGEPLSSARRWQSSIRAAHEANTPILAECGGMMALAQSLVDKEGMAWSMAGLMPGRAVMQTRLAGLGLQALATPEGKLRGHTFHYSRLEDGPGAASYLVKHPSATQGEALYKLGSLTASYFHAYFASCPAAVAALFSREPA